MLIDRGYGKRTQCKMTDKHIDTICCEVKIFRPGDEGFDERAATCKPPIPRVKHAATMEYQRNAHNNNFGRVLL